MTRLTRRRLLTITASLPFAAQAARASPHRLDWRGQALGADIRISLDGPPEVTRPALARARLEIDAYEQRFSLFRADSELVQVNRTGRLADPDPVWHAMLAHCDLLYSATGGLFDPTIQPLWQALATGGDAARARAHIGWKRITLPTPDRRPLQLAPGQALSFNGIAQGAATDAVRAALHAAGLRSVLVDIGETATLGGPWQLGVADPMLGAFAQISLTDQALAVSSPAALRLPQGATHILDPLGQRQPRWSSVAVLAESATTADGLSTAACMMSIPEARSAAQSLSGVRQMMFLDRLGHMTALTL